MIRVYSLMMAVGVSVMLAGCGAGSTLPEAQQREVSQALSVVMSNFQGVASTGTLLRARQALETERQEQLVFGTSSQLDLGSNCPSGSEDGCTFSCEGGVMTATCAGTGTETLTCGTTTYTAKDLSGTVVLDLSDLTIAGTTASGSMGFSLDLRFTLSGGGLTESALVCKFSRTVQFPVTAEVVGDDINCADFTCTFGGKTMTCDDFKSQLGSASCT